MDPKNLTGRRSDHRMLEEGAALQVRSGNQASDVRETFRYGNTMPAHLDRRPGTYTPKAPRVDGGSMRAEAVGRVATKTHRSVLERFEASGAAGSRGRYQPKLSTGPKVPMGKTLAGGVLLTSAAITGDLGPRNWDAQVLKGIRERTRDYMETEERLMLSGYGRFGGTTQRGFEPTLIRPGTRPKLGAYLQPGGAMPTLYATPPTSGSMTITTPLPSPSRFTIQAGSMSLAPFSFASASPSVGPSVIPLAAAAPAPGPAGSLVPYSYGDPDGTSQAGDLEKGGSHSTLPVLPAPSAPSAPLDLSPGASAPSGLVKVLAWSGLALLTASAVMTGRRRSRR